MTMLINKGALTIVLFEQRRPRITMHSVLIQRVFTLIVFLCGRSASRPCRSEWSRRWRRSPAANETQMSRLCSAWLKGQTFTTGSVPNASVLMDRCPRIRPFRSSYRHGFGSVQLHPAKVLKMKTWIKMILLLTICLYGKRTLHPRINPIILLKSLLVH